MTRLLVSEHYVWNEYPGLRAGRIYAGKPDITTRPRGGTHVVPAPDATTTLCGLPRSQFPNDFVEPVNMRAVEPCVTCGVVAAVPTEN